MTTAQTICTEMLETIEATITESIFQLRLSKNCIVKYNSIIQVGEMTGYCKDDMTAGFENTNNPSLWDSEGVKSFLKGTYLNGNGDVMTPEVIFYKDWYKNQLRKSLKIRATLRNQMLKLSN